MIVELAHKEIVQVAQYIIDSWKKPLKQNVLSCVGFTSIESLKQLYAKTKPTVKSLKPDISGTNQQFPARRAFVFEALYQRT